MNIVGMNHAHWGVDHQSNTWHYNLEHLLLVA